MSMTDPVADLLTRIRNGQSARKTTVKKTTVKKASARKGTARKATALIIDLFAGSDCTGSSLPMSHRLWCVCMPEPLMP
jgi:hypothetical protein